MNIIIVGAPHSYTSAVAKSYVDDGWGMSSWKETHLDWDLYEPNYTMKDLDLNKLAKDINTHDHCVYKIPMLALFLDELIPMLTGKIRVIYVIRNPMDIISSSIEKPYMNTPNYYLLRFAHIYEGVLRCPVPVQVVFGEKYVKERKIRKHNWKINRRVLKIWEWL